MKKTTKRMLLLSCSLMAAGLLFTGIGFAIGGLPGISWSKKGIASASSQTEYRQEKEKTQPFKNIKIDIHSMADVCLLPSDDQNFYVEYVLDGDYNTPSCEVKNNTLYLGQDGTSLSFSFDFNWQATQTDAYCNVYIPKDVPLGTLDIYNDAGNLTISSVFADTASMSLDFGDLTMKDSSFKDLTLEMDSGDISAKSVHAEVLSLSIFFGDSTLKDFSGKEASVYIDSGDFLMEAAALDSFTGENDFGDIELLLAEPLDSYSFDLAADFGNILLPENAAKGYYSKEEDGEDYYKTEGKADKTIHITVDSGDIEIKTL